MGRVEGEEFAPVLDYYSCFAPDQAAAESLEEAVDERGGVSLFVDGAKILRVPVHGTKSRAVFAGAIGIDLFYSFSSVSFAQEFSQRCGRKFGIGQAPVPILEGKLLDFDQSMHIGGAVVSEGGGIEALQHVEHLKHGHPLGVGRHLVDLVSAVRGMNRLDPGGTGVLEVLER